jgi:hypothetical protein
MNERVCLCQQAKAKRRRVKAEADEAGGAVSAMKLRVLISQPQNERNIRKKEGVEEDRRGWAC